VSSLNAEPLQERQAQVAERGAQVMPFSLPKTQHQFSETPTGGVQRVIARDPGDQAQIVLIRQHLQSLALQFSAGDYSGPASIHGSAMPGLKRLAQAKPSEIKITYQAESVGASLTFSSAKPDIIAAVHSWFAAQLHDHGHDALHMQHHPQ
jgi:hypothetical protein